MLFELFDQIFHVHLVEQRAQQTSFTDYLFPASGHSGHLRVLEIMAARWRQEAVEGINPAVRPWGSQMLHKAMGSEEGEHY